MFRPLLHVSQFRSTCAVPTEQLFEWARMVVEKSSGLQHLTLGVFVTSEGGTYNLMIRASSFDYTSPQTVLVGRYQRGATRLQVLENLNDAVTQLDAQTKPARKQRVPLLLTEYSENSQPVPQ